MGDHPYSSAYFTLGYWGADTNANVAWAVLNHNSEFAAWVIPEPAGLGLLGVALLMVGRRKRS